MKTQNTTLRLITLTAIAILLASCKETKKEHHAPESSMSVANGTYIDHYMKLKDALVSDDSVSASMHAKTLASSIQELDPDFYPVDDKQNFSIAVRAVAKTALQIPNADLAAQRESFESITKNMIGIVKNTGAPQVIYIQYCPMYKQGLGGYWLSLNEEVTNPLFGSMMIYCGMVTDKIKQ